MKLVMVMTSLVVLLIELANGDIADTVPTSNWASVYASDNRDFREPVKEQSLYPVADSASRSDWFQSYPYHKFQAQRKETVEDKPGLFESLKNSVKTSVNSVSNTVVDVGEGVVNGALKLVAAAETLTEDNRERDGHVHHASPLHTHPNSDNRDVSQHGESLQQSASPPVLRRQHTRLDAINGIKDFGSQVAGRFTKLTGLGLGATAKVSNKLFPWLSVAPGSTQSRNADVTIQAALQAPTPEQVADYSSPVVHNVAAPPQFTRPARHFPGPPQHARHPHVHPLQVRKTPYSATKPLLTRRHQRPILPKRPHFSKLSGFPSKADKVMYYMESPDLTKKQTIETSRDKSEDDSDIEIVYSQQELLLPNIPVDGVVLNKYVNPTKLRNEKQVLLNDIVNEDAWDSDDFEKALRAQIEAEAQAVRKLKRGVQLELAPADSLVFDLSQGWGGKVTEDHKETVAP